MSRNLTIFFLVFCLLGFFISCKGYKTKPRLEPEELQLAEKAAQLLEQSEQFSYECPESIRQDCNAYLEATNKFNHACQRFGPSSLQGRDAYDKMRFQASQFETKLRSANLPDLLQKWEVLRTEHIDKIGVQLGYKIQPETE